MRSSPCYSPLLLLEEANTTPSVCCRGSYWHRSSPLPVSLNLSTIPCHMSKLSTIVAYYFSSRYFHTIFNIVWSLTSKALKSWQLLLSFISLCTRCHFFVHSLPLSQFFLFLLLTNSRAVGNSLLTFILSMWGNCCSATDTSSGNPVTNASLAVWSSPIPVYPASPANLLIILA